MKKLKYILQLTLLSGIIATHSTHAALLDTDQDGVPDNAEALLHTDPQNADTDGDGMNDLKDPNPLAVKNIFKSDGARSPLVIKQVQVEDNYDYQAKKDASDHLELLVANQSDQPLQDLSLYYKITDEEGGITESYLKPLNGIQIPANGEMRIHLDDGIQPGHLRANPNSAYIQTPSAKAFHIEINLAGHQSVSVDLHKDKGGAEAAD